MTDTTYRKERPLSPHVQIYRWPITMAMSIAHRISGAALYFGTVLLCLWLMAAAYGPHFFRYVNGLYISWPGRIILFLYSFALMHHMVGGIRHLFWDVKPCLLGKACATKAAWLTLVSSVILTAVIWIAVYKMA